MAGRRHEGRQPCRTAALRFAAQVLRTVKRAAREATARHVMLQLVRAATGGGSNDEEARAAESRADLIHKLSVATKEMREALYWLKLVQEADLLDAGIADLVQQASEWVAILTASLTTARRMGNARNRELGIVNENRSLRLK